jgi:thiamine pyrophosphate-dependent acetolactate synthase large subunit-like protein
MASAVEESLAVVVVLWNNNSLKQIRDGFVERDIAPVAVDPKNPDFRKIAEGFGWQTSRVTSLAALGPAVRNALAAKAPVLVELDANAPQMLA